jgi:hypothetical protein
MVQQKRGEITKGAMYNRAPKHKCNVEKGALIAEEKKSYL